MNSFPSKSLEPNFGYYFSEKMKTRKEMANELGLSIRTFYRRLNEFNYKSNQRLLTPKQQLEIIHKLGYF